MPSCSRTIARRIALTIAIGACVLSAVPLGCSNKVITADAPAAADVDAGEAPIDPEPTATDAGSKRDAAKTGKEAYEACGPGVRCAEGLDCVISPENGPGGVCQKPCEHASDCEELEQCSDWCTPYCQYDYHCPSTLKCGSISCQYINCKNVPNACSASQECNPDGVCVEKAVACTKTPTSGLPSASTITSLGAAQRGTLCDWSTCQMGGYGTKAACDGGLSATQPANQAACVAKLPATCAATVADLEACIQAQAANPCDLSIVLTAPACAALAACH